ncbi:unnamed protein product [Closterium sp. Yama58-4]|nr:unnamed protein product [Closterium sp. Yama58-4]
MAKKEELTGRFSSWASHAVAQSQLGVALLLLPLLACVVVWGSFRARAPIAEGWGGASFRARAPIAEGWGEARASQTEGWGKGSHAGSQADQWSVRVIARGAGGRVIASENESVNAAGIAGVNRARWGPGGSEMGAGEARKGASESTREASREGEAREGEAREGEAREGEAQEGEARDGEAREGEARESTASLTAVDGQAEGVDGREEAEGEGIDGSVDGGGVKERGEGQGTASESAGGVERGGEDGGSGGGVERNGATGGEGGGKEERSNIGGGDAGGVGRGRGGDAVGTSATDKRAAGSNGVNSGIDGGNSGGSSGGAEGDINGSESGGARNGDGGGDTGSDSNGGNGRAVGGAGMAGGARKKGRGRKEKIQLDVPLACDLYRGSWVPDTSPPLYTNATCPNITRHQNCQGNGRPDSQYERWQWRPKGAACALPRFDAEEFMRVMRGRGVLFVGDSVARNHFESLVCLLSQVEQPEFHGSKSMLRLVFRSSKVTLARVNSAWLVEEGNDTVPDCPDSIPRLHLDRTSPKWFGEIGRFDVVMFSSAHWFVKPSIYMEKGEVIGSQGGWWKRDEPARVDNKGAFALAIRTVFRDVVKELGKNPNRVFIYRTFSPDHYEKGEWNTGGSCAGLTEPRGGNYTYNNTFGLNLYLKQLQAYNEVMDAAKEAGAGVDPLRFTLMDVMPSAGMRVDGHPGPYRGLNAAEELAKYKDSKFPPPQDCLHWCLPGPIDSWNVFLLQIMKRGFASMQVQGQGG